MKVYMVLTKVFYNSNGNDYQVADALEPITVYSSEKKADKAMLDYENYYKKFGYKRTDKHNNLFPVEHFQMKNGLSKRVIIYKLKEEVE